MIEKWHYLQLKALLDFLNLLCFIAMCIGQCIYFYKYIYIIFLFVFVVLA